jgi:predicted ATPase/transcriptional regulator with XRE-family HTH domain
LSRFLFKESHRTFTGRMEDNFFPHRAKIPALIIRCALEVRRSMDMSAPDAFGALLRHFRIVAGLTQEDLSDRSGISARAIRRLENSQHSTPHLSTVRFLAQALRLSEADARSLLLAARPQLAARPPEPDGKPVATEPGRALRATSTVPDSLTPFVGRAGIIESILHMLLDQGVRLLTITGPPGIGKTRLATEVSRLLQPDFSDGVHFVSLAPVGEPALVIPNVFEVVGTSSPQSEIRFDDLATAIGGARMLLVLDNMEHLLPAATVIPELLRRCPNLSVLATSQSKLHVSGEYRVPLHPLTLPPANGVETTRCAASEAEELFVVRARAVDAGFRLDKEAAAAIAGICRRVDGIPLAIELASAQLSSRTLTDLATRMEGLLPVLEGGPRDQPERLQTMAQSLQWSYSLLAPEEQQLLCRLSVFRGGFSLDAAAAVGDFDTANSMGVPDGYVRVSRVLTQLVEKNLVVRASSGRFILLQLVREFAAELLAAGGEDALVRDAHARFFGKLAAENERYNWIPSDPGLPQRFDQELPNFREALLWLETRGEGERMLALAAAMRWFWTARSDLHEGDEWLQRALALGSSASPAIRAKGLLTAGQISFYRMELDRTLELYEGALEAATASGDDVEIACASSSLAALVVHGGDYQRGVLLCKQALVASGRVSDRELGQAIAIWVPGTWGRAEHGLGNLDAAGEQMQIGLQQFMALGHSRGAVRVLGALGALAVDRGDFALALERYGEGLRLAVADAEVRYIAFNLKMIAAVWAMSGDTFRAARLVGAVGAIEERHGPTTANAAMDAKVEQAGMELIERELSATELEAAMEQGGSFTLDEVVAEALGDGVSLERMSL